MAKKSLSKYRKRRDLKKSPEPYGGKKKPSKRSPKFVIQKHAARNTHYDFRIEIDGVLVSWAVPKGPSLNPPDKRLAMRTDDHPLEYANFEGVIPKGLYGAGVVMVWDRGTIKNITKRRGKLVPLKKCLKDGHIEIFVRGKKIYGAYALVRTEFRDDKNQWLLVRMRDEYAHGRKNPVNTQNKSVKTGRTMTEIKREEDESRK